MDSEGDEVDITVNLDAIHATRHPQHINNIKTLIKETGGDTNREPPGLYTLEQETERSVLLGQLTIKGAGIGLFNGKK